MRKTWSESKGLHRTHSEVLLSDNSQSLEKRLLLPMNHLPQ
jgi:hypothetical protein